MLPLKNVNLHNHVKTNQLFSIVISRKEKENIWNNLCEANENQLIRKFEPKVLASSVKRNKISTYLPKRLSDLSKSGFHVP